MKKIHSNHLIFKIIFFTFCLFSILNMNTLKFWKIFFLGRVTHPVIVVEQLAWPLLLGYDTMAIYGAKVDAGRSTVKWDWEGARRRAEVVLARQEHLPAYSMRIVNPTNSHPLIDTTLYTTFCAQQESSTFLPCIRTLLTPYPVMCPETALLSYHVAYHKHSPQGR